MKLVGDKGYGPALVDQRLVRPLYVEALQQSFLPIQLRLAMFSYWEVSHEVHMVLNDGAQRGMLSASSAAALFEPLKEFEKNGANEDEKEFAKRLALSIKHRIQVSRLRQLREQRIANAEAALAKKVKDKLKVVGKATFK